MVPLKTRVLLADDHTIVRQGLRFIIDAEPDLDFDGAVADPAVVEDAWASWRREVAHAESVYDEADLDALCPHPDGELEVRDVLVHLVEEHARHCGHAALLRECIDGRTGQ